MVSLGVGTSYGSSRDLSDVGDRYLLSNNVWCGCMASIGVGGGDISGLNTIVSDVAVWLLLVLVDETVVTIAVIWSESSMI